MENFLLRDKIIRETEMPHIPDHRFYAAEFGIRKNSALLQTGALQKAIDTISASGGGRLILPEGKYRTGALQLKSSVDLHLEDPGTVLSFAAEEIEKNYPLVYSHWEGTPCYNYSPLLYALRAHDIAVTGTGILDGGADDLHWWNWHHQMENAWSEDKQDLQAADRKLLRSMNRQGIMSEDRKFRSGHFLRPNFLQPLYCTRVLLSGFTVHNSPMWQLNPVMCRSVVIENVNMSSHGPNNDGCDPESCMNVIIRNCRFDSGDDCISLKSGRDKDGREANIPCENILIEQNTFADGHGGIALGSEMSGGIRHIAAVRNHFTSPNLTYALRFKSNARRGGMIEDVVFSDCTIDHVSGAAVHGTMLYEDGRNGDELPVFRNIRIENIKASGGDYGIFLEAFKEVPIRGLVLKNINIDHAEKEMRCMNWQDPVLSHVIINGKTFPRPDKVRMLGVPVAGSTLQASAEMNGLSADAAEKIIYSWSIAAAEKNEKDICIERHDAQQLTVTEDMKFISVSAEDIRGNTEKSRTYRIIAEQEKNSWEDYVKDTAEPGDRKRMLIACCRLAARSILEPGPEIPLCEPVTRKILAGMLLAFSETDTPHCRNMQMEEAVRNGYLVPGENGEMNPEGCVTRQEMATVVMQCCGVNYRNASTTMPVCSDSDEVAECYGTNAARSLFFGFMQLDSADAFRPLCKVTMGDAIQILDRVADFAGI